MVNNLFFICFNVPVWSYTFISEIVNSGICFLIVFSDELVKHGAGISGTIILTNPFAGLGDTL